MGIYRHSIPTLPILRVGGFRLIWANGPTDTRAAGGYSTFLGTEKARPAQAATTAVSMAALGPESASV